jgi:hypothetical protein
MMGPERKLEELRKEVTVNNNIFEYNEIDLVAFLSKVIHSNELREFTCGSGNAFAVLKDIKVDFRFLKTKYDQFFNIDRPFDSLAPPNFKLEKGIFTSKDKIIREFHNNFYDIIENINNKLNNYQLTSEIILGILIENNNNIRFKELETDAFYTDIPGWNKHIYEQAESLLKNYVPTWPSKAMIGFKVNILLAQCEIIDINNNTNNNLPITLKQKVTSYDFERLKQLADKGERESQMRHKTQTLQQFTEIFNQFENDK